jgi:allophanate hydrolase
MAEIIVQKVGPGVTLQDEGRAGYLAQGLSQAGAADRLAHCEGAVLLGQSNDLAAIEIAGSFLTIEITAAIRIALTGMPMRARCNGDALAWQASHVVPAGSTLELSASVGGYSYLHLGGGVAAEIVLGAKGAHLAAGIGRMIAAGDRLVITDHDVGRAGLTLGAEMPTDGAIRLVATPQTQLFGDAELARFTATSFRKDSRSNRMGQRLILDGDGLGAQAGLAILSETVVPGDIQITGDGAPFVLLSECQTTGGYPRIGTVLPCDLPRFLRTPAGATVTFAFVSLEEAVRLELAELARRDALASHLRPLIRDPHTIPDLLAYQLISGVTRGDDLD